MRLLDEHAPAIDGARSTTSVPSDLRPCVALVAERADDTPVAWIGRDARYAEKLATPDTSVPIIGDVDPIRVAEGRYLGDELTIHTGSCHGPTEAWWR